MNRTLHLPDAVYAALRQAAEASGMSPADWIAARLPRPGTPGETGGEAVSPRSLAERFAGRTGVVGSGGRERLSEETGEKFTDYLEAKRRAGRL